MQIIHEKMSERAHKASGICRVASEKAQSYLQDLVGMPAPEKSKGQFVTEADKAIEQYIRSEFAHAFPGEHILGEEFGGAIAQSGWTLDPIDGTANFINGLPLWAVAIGHYQNGHEGILPDFGVIIMPMLNLAIVGEDKMVFVNGMPVARQTTPVSTLSVGHRSLGLDEEVRAMAQHLETQGIGIYNWRSSSVSMAYAALGYISGHVQRNVNYWDLVPGGALCRAAGMRVHIEDKLGDALPLIKACDEQLSLLTKELWADKQES